MTEENRAPSNSHTAIPVTVDDRELRGSVATILAASETFKVKVKRLAVGDYLIDNAVLFERKTLSDLAASIKQGRLFSQALRLAESEVPAALVLEGGYRDLAGSRMRREALQGALITIALFIGLPVLRSRDAEETVRLFRYAAQQRRTVAIHALPRRGHRPRGKAALQGYILQGLPGIGPAKAEQLLKRFGSIEAVLRADPEALAEVPGIGSRIAEKIRWAVEEPPATYLSGLSRLEPPNLEAKLTNRLYPLQ